MLSSTTIQKNLDIQERLDTDTIHIELMRDFLSCVRTTDQWRAFINTYHVPYGKLSYQCYHCYSPSPELLAIYNRR